MYVPNHADGGADRQFDAAQQEHPGAQVEHRGNRDATRRFAVHTPHVNPITFVGAC